MKYMWSNKNVTDSVNMRTRNDDVIVTSEYNLKMMESLRRTSPKKAKRFRSAFTTDQVNYLEKQFKKFAYIGNAQRKEVAIALNIPERAVKIWFQNRRMKEKKESTTKEFDDEPSNRKSLEFAKDQLNNVSKPSVNDQQTCSLPSLTDVNKTNCDFAMTNNFSSSLNTGLLMANSVFKPFEDRKTANTVHVTPPFVEAHPIPPKNNTKSAEFSINLCNKMYKNEPMIKLNNVKPTSVKEHDIKQTMEQKPYSYKLIEQMVPEDLSSRKINFPATSQTQSQSMTPNNPGYISVLPTVSPLYAQPYYSAGGVIWKPINVVPTVTAPGPSVPVSVASSLGSIPTVLESVPKKCCTCDCHVKPQVAYNFQQQTPSPQFIITAVQFPNPSGAKF